MYADGVLFLSEAVPEAFGGSASARRRSPRPGLGRLRELMAPHRYPDSPKGLDTSAP
jgi:hypothetical protein